MKNWFELIKQAGIAPVVVHDEEQYPAGLVRLCELVAAAEREACAELMERQHSWITNTAASAAIRAGGAS